MKLVISLVSFFLFFFFSTERGNTFIIRTDLPIFIGNPEIGTKNNKKKNKEEV